MYRVNVGSNQSEVYLQSQVVVFVSFDTPVAARLCDGSFIRTNEYHSITTSKHLNQWLRSKNASDVQTVSNKVLETVILNFS
jgi:hypothetical protein